MHLSWLAGGVEQPATTLVFVAAGSKLPLEPDASSAGYILFAVPAIREFPSQLEIHTTDVATACCKEKNRTKKEQGVSTFLRRHPASIKC
jgi:hypothetical protein